jgi:hypothetical protein
MTNAEYYKSQGVSYEYMFELWVQEKPKNNRPLNAFFWWLDAERPPLTKFEKEFLMTLLNMCDMADRECYTCMLNRDNRLVICRKGNLIADMPIRQGKFFSGMELGKLYSISDLLV